MYDRIKSFFFENIYMYTDITQDTGIYIYIYICTEKETFLYEKLFVNFCELRASIKDIQSCVYYDNK